MPRIEIACKRCKKTFKDYRYRNRRFCSHKCSDILNRGNKSALGNKSRTGLKFSNETIKKLSGKNSHNWVGDKIQYSGIHAWVAKLKGNAKKCNGCGKLGRRVKGRWNLDWANVDHKYRRVLKDFIGLCKKCHGENNKIIRKYAKTH